MKVDKIYQGKIPFRRNPDGTVIQLDYDYGSRWPYNEGIEQIDNYIFEDTLHYTGYGRGRSSITIEFESVKGDKYTMFISEFDEVLKAKQEPWNLKGRFTFSKRGANFGLRFLGST